MEKQPKKQIVKIPCIIKIKNLLSIFSWISYFLPHSVIYVHDVFVELSIKYLLKNSQGQ